MKIRAATSPAMDRTSVALGLALALHLAFFLALAWGLFVATQQARAGDIACTGNDLVAELAADDPARLARIREQASRTLNGDGLLWRVRTGDAPPSWLFGTMHVTDPRVVAIPAAAREALDAADRLVIETTDILDPSAMLAAIVAHPELTMFTGGETLIGLLDTEERRIVEDGLRARGVPPGSVSRMKPWMLSAMVALPACEGARRQAGAKVLDVVLAEQATAAGKPVSGLESMVDQLQAMASLPMEFHIEGLVETIRLGDRIDDVTETMMLLYRRGEIGMIWPLFREILPAREGSEGGFVAFEEAMITSRNRRMAERAAPMFAEGGAFVAVGALHLPGEEGLVELLRAAGHQVERVD